ncbi:hypothetical protein C4573_04680 [Candidatus Woesearchaeota archaeon]|nr:MAG: hypothetical protein C4573_04680 [Candidatus Woesearchaeota archaeon]
MRKSQVTGHLIIYIFVIIVVGVILLLGFSAFKKLSQRNKEVQALQFKTTFEQNLNLGFGALDEKTYSIPSSYNTICFADTVHVDPGLMRNYPVIGNLIRANVTENLFLFSDEEFTSFFVKDMELPYPYFFCLEDASVFTLILKGKETKTVVIVPPSRRFCEVAQTAGICPNLETAFADTGYNYTAKCQEIYGVC